MFLAKDKYERTAWHMATYNSNIEVLIKLWEWAKNVLTQEHLQSMFLATEESKRHGTWQ